MIYRTLLAMMMVLLSACTDSGDPDEQSGLKDSGGDHVWKSQTDMIEKAREVEDVLGEASAQQRQLIDDQTR